MMINGNYCKVDTIYVSHCYFKTEEEAKDFAKYYKEKYGVTSIMSNRGKDYVYRGEEKYRGNYVECPYEITINGQADEEMLAFEKAKWNR